MTALTTQTYIGQDVGYVKYDQDRVRAIELKRVLISVAATTMGGSTIAVTLADYGLKNFLSIRGVKHTTANTNMTPEAPTTAVASGVLTITVGGAGTAAQRSYIITGEVL